jgi:hypothetical protein
MKCGVHCTILNEYYCLQYTLGKKWCVFNVCTSRKMRCDIRIQIKEKSPKFSLFVEVLRDRVACPMTEHHLWPNTLLISFWSLLGRFTNLISSNSIRHLILPLSKITFKNIGNYAYHQVALRSNPHTLFLCFRSSKNICSPPPSTSNVVKIPMNQ